MPNNYCYTIPMSRWRRSRGLTLLSRLRRQDCLALAFEGYAHVHMDGTAVLTRSGQKALKRARAEYKRRGIRVLKSWSKPRKPRRGRTYG